MASSPSGRSGDSYYYSDTRLSISGSIDDHGELLPVSGLAWKDRQWGNFLVLPSSGWNWFSLQLDDGNDLMLFVLRDPTGAVSPVSGTLVLPNGQVSPIPASAASVTSTGTWRSPRNGATYPSGWRVVLPERDLDLTLTPVLLDQELD